MVKWSEEGRRNTKSNREGKESEEIIYGGGNRPSGLFEIQLFTSSTHIMIERQAPSLFFFKRPALSTGPATTLVPRIDRWIDGWIDRWGEYINNRWEEAIQVFRGQREEIHPHTRPCAKKACTFYRDYRFCIYPSKQGAVKRDSSDTCDCQIRGIGRWSLSLSFSLLPLLFLPPLNDPRSGTRDLCVKRRIIAARFSDKSFRSIFADRCNFIISIAVDFSS